MAELRNKRLVRRLGAATALALIAVSLTASAVLAGHTGPGRDPVILESTSPGGDAVPTDAPILLTFSEPMARATVAVYVSPAVTADVTWVDDWTLRLVPTGLMHGTTYEVRVRGLSASGGVLRGPRTFQFTTVAGAPTAINPGAASVHVPMLLYHYVRVTSPASDYMGYRLSVAPAEFTAQMDWLARNGYHPVTLREVLAFLRGQSGLPSKPIVITFDDGYADFYTNAMPVLRSHDFTAVSFVVSGFIGRSGYMSKAQVVGAQNAGFEIGSHTVDHVNLIHQSDGGLANEVSSSKRALEGLLGKPVVSFCYPYGKFGQREVGAVMAAGYQDATATSIGGSERTLSNRYVWSRIRVNGGESLTEFAYSIVTG